MQLELINETVYLKTNDTATDIALRVLDDMDNPFPLDTASKIEVVIGVEEGRLITLPVKLLSGVGELEFGLDNGDLLPSGDLRLEVHIFTAEGEMHNAPSKGYYRLRMQKPIDELGVEVTTYTLDYFLEQVDKATAGIPAMIEQGQAIIDDMNEAMGEIDGIKQGAKQALEDATTANAAADATLLKANDALTKSETALTNATTATDRANTAATNADNKAALAQSAADTANAAATRAEAGATEAQTQANSAKTQAQAAESAATAANSAADRANNAAAGIEGWTGAIQWVAGTYNKNNIVAYNGSTFQARKDGVTSTPPQPPVTNADWIVLALRGIDGTGAVSSVNHVLPDGDGNVVLTADSVDTYTKSAIDAKVKTVNDRVGTVETTVTEQGNDLVDLSTQLDAHLADLFGHGGVFDMSLTNKVEDSDVFVNVARLSSGTANGVYSELKETVVGSGVYDILEVKVGDGVSFTKTMTFKLTYVDNAVIKVELMP